MRLPWPSRRSAGRSTGGAAAPAAGDGVQQPLAPPVGRSEWREVGALRPSFRADPGIRVQRFGDDLAGSHRPEPILRPLGHERTADGPAGLVTGLARLVVARVVTGTGGTQSLPLVHRKAPADTGAAPDVGIDEVAEQAALPPVEPRHAPVAASPVAARRLTVAPPPAGPSSSALATSASPATSSRSSVVQRASAPLVAATTPLTVSPTAPVAGRAWCGE